MVINITNDQSGFEVKRGRFGILLIYLRLTVLQAIDDITTDNEFKELWKYKLDEHDWELLTDYQQILQVINS